MTTLSTVGNGYYNYYHDKNRYETPDGRVKTAWYDRDLSTEEIVKNNAGVLNKDFEGADLCRQLADTYRSLAESNRAKYSTSQEVKDAIWLKYSSTGEYSAYSREERTAMACNEIHMTLFGTIELGYNVWNDPHIKGKVSKNTHNGSDEAESRSFNINMLGAQFKNLWNNNGIDVSQMNGSRFLFSVNGMNMQAFISILDGNNPDSGLLESMTNALNSKDNARNLFYNLLHDGNRQGILPKDSMAKYRLYRDFYDVTGLDITAFKQTEKGFFDADGRNALDIYDENNSKRKNMLPEFRQMAKDYFKILVDDAMKYNISDVPDLVLSMEYRNGEVFLYGEKTHFDLRA